MRDYTVNIYCDYLWIDDLLKVQKNKENKFFANVTKNNVTKHITFSHVIIFGTIVGIKQLDETCLLYQVDDGTGVIVCKHNLEQFKETFEIIEREQDDILNQTFFKKTNFEESSLGEVSDDSIFNDKSIQNDEMSFIKKNTLNDIQSIWNNIYESFTNLMGFYQIGDVVLIEGKLYNYFNVNQIYINSIKHLDVSEEIMKVSIKLKDGFESLGPIKKVKSGLNSEKRLSGLMTFDHIHQLNPGFPNTRNISPTKLQTIPPTLPITPHLNSTITFDTMENKNNIDEATTSKMV